MSDTPRTDRTQADQWPMNGGAVSADFARELERENTALKALLAECRPYLLASQVEGASKLYAKALANR